ncbi:MAG TPA: phosphoribosylformylglycinamidine synthase subunit PurS, partial [Tepidisphaeraceae bacterium]|nr:phosphoribosylformylglycinamidine synthase subunit PurS [Tepidisphaeraceae bacterium]
MIHRIDVRTTPLARGGEAAIDPVGEALRHQIQEFGTNVGPITTSRIFLIDSVASQQAITRAAGELLADPVVEQATVVAGPVNDNGQSRIEIHLKPGVMDPVAASTEMALRDMGIDVKEVRTGRAYLIEGKVARGQLQTIANRVLANGVIESVHFDAYVPQKFETGREYRFELRHVPLRSLTDEQLTALSRQGHLFLSLAEMKAIQAYYREQGREPTDVELETLAQTWSEHCVHKTLKSAVDVQVVDESGKLIGTRHYKNLIKETIFASTQELMRTRKHADPHSEASPAVTILPPLPPGEGRGEGKPQLTPTGQRESSAVRPHPNPLLSEPEPEAQPQSRRPEGEGMEDFCLSVFADNAGVIAFDDTDAVCFKVETH